jgi:cysteinyl-tRNA synthetase
MIRELEAKGFTYAVTDGIYFDTARDPNYGALSRLRASAEHARVDAMGKRQAADFALWKFSPSSGSRRQLEWLRAREWRSRSIFWPAVVERGSTRSS